VVKVTPTPAKPVREPTPQINLQALFPTPTLTVIDFALADGRHFQGNHEAPVTIVEFSDFKCPYCGRFSTETLPQLRQLYINTGQVRLVYRHFAILGPESDYAAAAAECAAEQGQFWAYHDQIFADQAATRSTLTHDQLLNLAQKTGLPPLPFSDCLLSGRYTNQVRRDMGAARALSLKSTPSFLINDIFIIGAQPFEVFQQVIEEQLSLKLSR
jgi:protein-disulfide isomerase